MESFSNEGFDLAYQQKGEGDPVLLLHGFGSSSFVNWVNPGWFKTLTEAGYRVIAFDHRGHGQSSLSYETRDYTPSRMAADAAALLDHLEIPRAHVMGYSMGARVAAFMALEHPKHVATVIFGGLGIGMVKGLGDWDQIADALLATDPATITHPRAQMFRAFADQTRSDRRALAACIESSRQLIAPDRIAEIAQPALVAVGTTDDIAGEPGPLADLMPNATAFAIEGRDHMQSVGDRSFKARVLQFLMEHPL
ncbi:alpha/beta hydrolase [Mesorhizobium sp. Z1-4]|uniref:alpha/beta fold hydrolase n=1 Tax=Mesorhizobium sp. Z1-4 TaxID=2448478 RepID=UPI000FDA471F|nr:alpha/beta hydrolase [Mesorhizobium sp. Z1-4]